MPLPAGIPAFPGGPVQQHVLCWALLPMVRKGHQKSAPPGVLGPFRCNRCLRGPACGPTGEQAHRSGDIIFASRRASPGSDPFARVVWSPQARHDAFQHRGQPFRFPRLVASVLHRYRRKTADVGGDSLRCREHAISTCQLMNKPDTVCFVAPILRPGEREIFYPAYAD